ncbi:SCO2400 family protein [Streptomyces galbus]|uniref:Zinc ribbon domain-containing protein n=1 Tax=Streptomyces galbus TaxID=33898 RepID=A0ABX1ISA3_STRGB|nr:hypothetical protein [Streptomyces galbus]NKQ28519.1 hypothetical protein [Streptomyces galbus]
MDYCSACRRHLNGALVCPGCGAYAPDIAPPGTEGRRPFAAGGVGAMGGVGAAGGSGPRGAWDDVTRGRGSVLPPSWHEDHADGADGRTSDADHVNDADQANGADRTDLAGVPCPAGAVAGADGPRTGDVRDAPPAPQGRAARRRQRVRWKKSQRRAVVATAVALVGGGLTLAPPPPAAPAPPPPPHPTQ